MLDIRDLVVLVLILIGNNEQLTGINAKKIVLYFQI
jgi:hypothetical protein